MTTIIIFAVLLLILLILWIHFTYRNYRKNQESFTNFASIGFGNVLCFYFTQIGISFYEGKNFELDKEFVELYDKNEFTKHLPRYLELDIDIQNKLLSIKPDDFEKNLKMDIIGNWSISTNTLHSFWSSMKPLVQKIYIGIFKKINLEKNIIYPVIHYRCSDVPFIKSPHYKLQKYNFYKDAIQILKNKGIANKKVYILYNNKYGSNNENQVSCDNYMKNFQYFLQSITVDSEIRVGTEIEDFSVLFYAPAVISTGSSFSFMSGFFGNGIFISSGHSSTNNDKSNCTNCDWLIDNYSVEHTEIDTYNDVETVEKILRS